VRTFLGGTVNSSLAQSSITWASDAIARHCGRVFRLETVTEQFRLDKMQTDLVLTRYPVTAIASITEGDLTLSETTDYEVDLTKGILTRLYNDRVCFWSRRKVTVGYSAGYEDLTDVPPALQRVCLELVSTYYNADPDRDPLLRSDVVDGLGGKTYYQAQETDLLSPEVRGLLNQFKRFRVGG
jgi:hypothetical protein